MKSDYYKRYIDVNTKRKADISELFQNPKVFSNLISDMVALFRGIKIDKVIGIDAYGFVLAAPMALKLKKPLVLVRKEGKLPGLQKNIARVSIVDYKERKIMEVLRKSIKKGDRVLIVDEWIESGGQMKGVVKLLERLGAKIVGIGVINADRKKCPRILLDKYNLQSLINKNL
ncbi:adenine phosphoribosyltransferase [Candidatus Pacearchaeota archaeon]|nr:adenine phosphoribosyltransferase [Candidatus Pacearchaeota archaeon]